MRIDLGNSIYLNEINTDKFKSSMITYSIVRPLNREEVTKNALLPLVLRRGSRNYENNLKIQKRLEELYGARLGVSVLIRGNKQVLNFSMRFIDEKFALEDNYFEEAMDLIYGVIFEPLVEESKFKKEYVDREKKSLKQRIESKINDKRSYAIENAISIMCEGESFSIPNLGYLEDLDYIDEKSLYNHYLEVLSSSPIEIFYTGEKNNKLEDYFKEKKLGSKVKRGNILTFEREKVTGKVEKLKSVEKKMDINQGKLVLGYRTGTPYEDPLYEALLVANVIFGGGSNSKLFLNVRERESLAYYIASRLYKFKSIIILDAGVEFDKVEKTKEIIALELENMKSGRISQEEIEIAKTAIISDINGMRDSLSSITEFNFGGILTSDKRSLDDRISAIEQVTYEDVVEASKNIELDTVYLLTGNEVKK